MAMKRDMDFIRQVLLKIEDGNGRTKMVDLLPADAPEEDLAKLQYHMGMLVDEAGLVRGIAGHSIGRQNWVDLNLTWQGHEFLDAVRDSEVWRRTKEGASRVGSFTIGFLVEIAKTYAKQVAKERLGLDLG
jgi:hypothetical protein